MAGHYTAVYLRTVHYLKDTRDCALYSRVTYRKSCVLGTRRSKYGQSIVLFGMATTVKLLPNAVSSCASRIAWRSLAHLLSVTVCMAQESETGR
jgi:hypothetical protein